MKIDFISLRRNFLLFCPARKPLVRTLYTSGGLCHYKVSDDLAHVQRLLLLIKMADVTVKRLLNYMQATD
jgi:hypothetical protein